MAGFLDKNDRVVDMILTSEGRKLLAKGRLRFAYFSLFDDEVDYNPVLMNSGSLILSGALSGAVRDQIEEGLVREAVSGYRNGNVSGSDFVNVRSPLFTMPQGNSVLPRLTGSFPTGSVSVEVKIQKVQDFFQSVDKDGNILNEAGPFDRGYQLIDSSTVSIDLAALDNFFSEDRQDGVRVTVFRSGSEGPVELPVRRDFDNGLAFDADLRFSVRGKDGR